MNAAFRACGGRGARFVVTHNASRKVLPYVPRFHKSLPAVRLYSSKGKEQEVNGEPSQAGAQTAEEPKDKPPSQVEPKPEDDIAAKLQAKQDEVVDLTGRLRYAQADFINLQRISAREKEQTKDFAISRFASDLLETADTLALALRASNRSEPNKTSVSSNTPPAYFDPSNPKPDALVQGVEATQRMLLQTFAKYGIKPYDPTGDMFDPNLHEALYSAPVPGKGAGEILECQKIGYMIKERVLRAAQVGVAAEPPAESSKKSDPESHP